MMSDELTPCPSFPVLAMTGEPETVDPLVADGSTDADTTDRSCPKCRREALPGESACARCGLLVARFDLFRESGDPPELSAAWDECCAAWGEAATHDRALSVAVRLECLPLLARRYRERLESGSDPLAERRLSQIAVLIESAIRSQAGHTVHGKAARFVWVLGYLMAGAVLVGSAWIFMLAMRHHG